MDYRKLLNEKQYEAVSTDAQYARIIAGAGSGKTRVLTYRISYLISELDVKPSTIVAIAFTNKVAEEMRDRALKLLEGKGKGIRVSTFHSFCAKFLRRYIDVLHFPINFTILDDEDQETIVKRIASEHDYKKNDPIVKKTLAFIAGCKTRGYYPDDVVFGPHPSEEQKQVLEFYELYEEEKARCFSLDFDDLLLKTIQILKSFPEIRTITQNEISNLLIDEFQDTNDVQYELVKLLVKPTTSVFVVGDPDQTIYTWRGANQDLILNFDRDFRPTRTIILNENYRSTKKILDTANKLIAHNKKRVPKDLFTENDDGEEIVVKNFYKREFEAKFVVDEIERQKNKNPGLTYRDFAVLYRAAYLSLPFESELMQRGIPYQIYGGIKFFQRREVKDVLAYFRLIFNTRDDVSFERIANAPKRGLSKDPLARLTEAKKAEGLTYLEYCENIFDRDVELKASTKLNIDDMVKKIKDVREKLSKEPENYPDILAQFVTDIRYLQYLEAENDNDTDDRLGNVKTLLDNIKDFKEKHPESKFEEYLENAALQASQDEINDRDSVLLMTIHVAKGLEFPYVFVVGMMDGIFPSERTVSESKLGMEEERRLCYVAFTRAKKKLHATYNTGFSYITNGNGAESPFIKEAGLSAQKVYTPEPFSSNIRSRHNFDDFEADNDPDPYFNSFFGQPVQEVKPREKIIEDTETNNVSHWAVGDLLHHEKFGDGVVVEVMKGDLIKVNFELHGEKILLGTHKMISKIGGQA